MCEHSIILQEFEDNFEHLAKISKKGNQIFDILKLILSKAKKEKVPFIGNPYLKLQNQLIEFNYSLNLHLLNCTVY